MTQKESTKPYIIPVQEQLKNRGKKTVQDLMQGWITAEWQYYRKRVRLVEVYEKVRVDSHLKSVINNRKSKVLGEDFVLIDKKTDLQNLLKLEDCFKGKNWFVQFLDILLDSIFFGHSLIEFTELAEDTQGKRTIKAVTCVERRNIVPEDKIVLTNWWDTSGICWENEIYNDYYISAFYKESLGLLLSASVCVLYKEFAMEAWMRFAEKYGKPIPMINTPSNDKEKKKILDEVFNMGEDGGLVLGQDDKIQFANAISGDNATNFEKIILLQNSEISKLILGQTMTTENGSSKSQGEVHERTSFELAEMDMQWIQALINDELIPRMVRLGGYPVELLDCNFEFAYFYNQRKEADALLKKQEEEATNSKFDRVVKLLPFVELDDKLATYIEQEFGIPVKKKVVQSPLNKTKKPSTTPKNTSIIKKKSQVINEIKNQIDDTDFAFFQSYYDLLAVAFFGGDTVNFNTSIIELTNKILLETLLKIEYAPDTVVLQSLKDNIFKFSCAKNYQELKNISKELLDEEGNKRTLAQFKEAIKKLNIQFNQQYLSAEYEIAVTSAQMISKWNELTENGANMDVLLTFDAVGDGKTTEICKSTNKITRPASDSFWNTHAPPLHWGCRSTLKKGAKITKIPDDLPSVDAEFAFNPAKKAVIYSQKHDYFKNLPKEIKTEMEELLKKHNEKP
jgi:hypothetical protein